MPLQFYERQNNLPTLCLQSKEEKMHWFYVFMSIWVSTSALDNGLALTPPMGWMSWLHFGCETDCAKHPQGCISEDLIKRTADRMASDGYKDVGYEYVIIDDCWLEKERVDGKIVGDKQRFKSGIKALSDYVHSKGLKFGIYQDIGTFTCQRYPGLQGHEKIDVETLASWEIDYLKVDGCYENQNNMPVDYPALGKLLNESGRPILYSCSWPAYTNYKTTNFTEISKHCNIWRNYVDIGISWGSVLSIMGWFGDRPELADYAGPGSFNDPDMLVIGNSGLNVDQARAQLVIWSVLAAPLLMSTDLDLIKPEFKEILLNKDILAVNQDSKGYMGKRVYVADNIDVWQRNITKGIAIAVLNKQADTKEVELTHKELHLPNVRFKVKDYFKEDEDQTLDVDGSITVKINGTGVKFFNFDTTKTEDWISSNIPDDDEINDQAYLNSNKL